MSIRTFFGIILKIIGLLFIRELVGVVLQIISTIWFFINSSVHANGVVSALLIAILLLLVYSAVVYFFVFKSEVLIDKLQLDKGFAEQEISLNIHRSTILSISIIVIGGLMVAEEVPDLIRNLLSYWEERSTTFGLKANSFTYVIGSAAKIIIGLVLMAGQRQIVNLIERNRKK